MTIHTIYGVSTFTVPANATGVSAQVNLGAATISQVAAGIYTISSPSVGPTDRVDITYTDVLPLIAYARANPGMPVMIASSAVPVSGPANTSENVLVTIPLPGGALGKNGTIELDTLWSYTNNANTKTMRTRLGGIGGTIFQSVAATTTASSRSLAAIHNRNSESSQGGPTAAVGFGTSTSAITTSAINTAADTSLVITAQKGVAGDTLTLERYVVRLTYLP
jgi:hypothetical protein